MTPIEYYAEEFETYKDGHFVIHEKYYKKPENAPFICPRAVCADGFSISIQASRFHYCIPKIAGASEYDSMELGYPSERDILLDPYMELLGSSTWQGVYPYVPYEIVEKLVEKHGGIVAHG